MAIGLDRKRGLNKDLRMLEFRRNVYSDHVSFAPLLLNEPMTTIDYRCWPHRRTFSHYAALEFTMRQALDVPTTNARKLDAIILASNVESCTTIQRAL